MNGSTGCASAAGCAVVGGFEAEELTFTGDVIRIPLKFSSNIAKEDSMAESLDDTSSWVIESPVLPPLGICC
jgi:hypothetical protein